MFSRENDAAPGMYLTAVYRSNVLGERSNHTLRSYDDAYGPAWLYRDASGLVGVVRARTWEDAWEIVTDEILDDADPDDYANLADDADLPEGLHFRSNGAGHNRWNQTGIAQEDLNGSRLEPLTGALIESERLILVWTNPNDCDPHCTCNDCIADHIARLE